MAGFSPISEAKLPQAVFERNSFEVGDVCLEIKDIGDWKSILDPFIQIPSIIPPAGRPFRPQIPFKLVSHSNIQIPCPT